MPEEIKRDFSKMIDIFSPTAAETQTTTAAVKEYNISELPISLLRNFPNHPFALYEGEKFDDLVESVKAPY